MAAEPIVIYSHKVDPDGVLQLLKSLAPDAVVTPGAGGWSRISIAEKRFLRKAASIHFGHSPDYYAGSDFAKQMRGMQGYFSRFPNQPNLRKTLMLIDTFRFGMSLFPAPEPDLVLQSGDSRLRYLFAVVKHLDGAIFTPSGLWDAQGRGLCVANGKPDPQAQMPGIFVAAPHPSEMYRFQGGTKPNPPSPSAGRIAKRALCLMAVSYRGMQERDPCSPQEFEREQKDLLDWIGATGISEEFEEEETNLICQPRPSGMPEEMTRVEWNIEATAVLAWALGKLELSAYDQQAEVGQVAKAIGFLSTQAAIAFINEAALRPAAEIERLSTQLLAIHWRLREQRLRPRRMNFETESQKAWYGRMPRTGVRFIDGDLAVGDRAIHDATDVATTTLQLAVQQRHQAINWLCGASEVYSKTDTRT